MIARPNIMQTIIILATLAAWTGPKHKNIAVGFIGDSITTGAMARFKPDPKKQFEIQTKGILSTIRTFFRLPQLLPHISERLTYSWASGKKSNSIMNRLQSKYPNEKFHSINAAFNGARLDSFQHQAKLIRDSMNVKGSRYDDIKLITVFLGHNDVCESEEPDGPWKAKLESDIERGLSMLSEIRSEGRIRVMISAIAPITRLKYADFRSKMIRENLTCEMLWKKLYHKCARNLLNDDAEESSKLQTRYASINALLEATARNWGRKQTKLDVLFSALVSEMHFDVEHLSGDCFHPSVLGQAKLAEALWSELKYVE